MTLDDGHMTARRLMVEQRDRERAAALADWQHEQMMESVAAEEQRWANRWAQQTADLAMSKELHPSRYIDTRCFAVDGDTDRPDQ